jgi:antitoxin component of RelBE/YafQ-DinJ toxin-antitoxin module
MPAMKKTYDFSTSVANPCVKRPKKQLTIRLDEETIDYFQRLSEGSGIPYQSFIRLYLRNCAAEKKTPYEVGALKSMRAEDGKVDTAPDLHDRLQPSHLARGSTR